MECLNLPLATYTLGHELVLLRQRSPFLCLSRSEFDGLPYPQQVLAITLAVQICAAPAAFRWPFSAFLWRHRSHDYSLAIADFRNYLTANRQILPALSAENKAEAEAYEIANKGEKISAGRPLGSPLIANLINYCLTELRLDYQEALASPFGVTANLYFSALEAKGRIYIENHNEKTIRAEMEANRNDLKQKSSAAHTALAACQSVAEREAAYEKNELIGNLFANEWRLAETEEARQQIFNKWGNVAITELQRAQIDPAPYMNARTQPITSNPQP